MSNYREKEVMGYHGWRVGKRPLLTWGGKKKSRKKVLDSDPHAISAANTSSQLKLLVKGVRAEEMHLPN